MASNLRVGVDVGGTNTDAVVMVGNSVAASVKVPTTDDVTGGILSALTELFSDTDLSPASIVAVMIGTTHFTNAVVEASGLAPTAVIRLGLPATSSLPPLVDWPDRLAQAIGNHTYLCRGGHEYDGREIAPMDYKGLQRIVEEAGLAGVRSFAITSVFSPVNSEFEHEAASMIKDCINGASISLSNEIGRIGLLERENATAMNACLIDLASRIVDAFETAVADFGISAPLYISQNDGTLMNADYTRQYPVATFASGPTNSMRGAAFLSGLTDCAVVDVGGTTSDVGVLVSGFPREASATVDICDVRTNFRMPDLISIGLGGGSLIRDLESPTVGPDSVGFRLPSRSLVFGGDTLTATDVAVAAGLTEIGDPDLVAHLDPILVARSRTAMQESLAEAVDRLKIRPEDVPLVAVGGGSFLVEQHLPGTSEVLMPDNGPVANAIGAAIDQVGGEIDRIFSLQETSREEVLDLARQEAVQRTVDAGASSNTVEVVEVEEVPLSYLPSSAVRVRVKAIGDLEFT
ncbi:MAG: hydantoinase/oxoprolinase family protein [Acidimicrobiales bacterium]|nr:hydantoinase/oxoprolinase family protein [Acidimicrobiales bacterium]